MSKTTLKPGDLVMWDEEREDRSPALMMVSDDGQELLFQFGTKPFSQMEIPYDDGRTDRGLTVAEVEAAIKLGVYPLAFPGILFKVYDKETGQSHPDPRLELGDE